MEHAKVNGVELAYEVVGSGEPMLFIHGAHLADALKPLVTEPALERFQRIRYHRRGLGGSSRPVETEPTSVAEQAEDAAGLLDHLGVGPAHVVGHSWGGAIALELAAQHPTTVASLVLLEPAFLTTPAGAAFGRALAPLVERYEAGDAEGAVHGFLALVGARNWRAIIEQTVPGGIDQAVKDATTFFEIELPDRRGPSGPSRRRPSPAPCCPSSAAGAARCSSRAACCSTPGSRPAETPTSPARPTCSRCRCRGRWRRRSPPSCDRAGCAPPGRRYASTRAGPPKYPGVALTASWDRQGRSGGDGGR
jgi:pimeloyl-ACP methyl ester carboxylesterase